MPTNNITTTEDINVLARRADFVSQFSNTWKDLLDLMSVTRLVRKAPGSQLYSKKASVTLADGNVAEGEIIPNSKGKVTEQEIGKIKVKKYLKTTTIEAIEEFGYDTAIQSTDEELRNELQAVVMSGFTDFIKTGTLTSTETSFQSALAMAKGRVLNKWKGMRKSVTDIVAFVNVLDLYGYLGAAEIDEQSQHGLNYVSNFLGYNKIFLMSENEIPQGKVIATPTSNLILYYVNPSDSEFAKGELKYTVDGDTPLIGFHTKGSYDDASSKAYAIMGMDLLAEYLDGIAVVTIDPTGA